MNYSERLALFCYWADHYGLEIIRPKFVPDETSTDWAK